MHQGRCSGSKDVQCLRWSSLDQRRFSINKYKHKYNVLQLAAGAILSCISCSELFLPQDVAKLQDANMPTGKTEAQKRLAVHKKTVVTSVSQVRVSVNDYLTKSIFGSWLSTNSTGTDTSFKRMSSNLLRTPTNKLNRLATSPHWAVYHCTQTQHTSCIV